MTRPATRRKPIATAIAIVLLSMSAHRAHATLMTFTSRADFEDALDTIVVDDYENSAYAFSQDDAPMSAVLGETDYRTTGFDNHNLVPLTGDGHYYCAGCNGSFELLFTSTSVSGLGLGGVFGVGFEYFNAGTPSYVAFITLGDGATANVPLSFATFPATSFFGFTASESIASIAFGLQSGGATRLGSFGIDNLTIGNAARVPAPSSLLLLSIGLVGIVAHRVKAGRTER